MGVKDASILHLKSGSNRTFLHKIILGFYFLGYIHVCETPQSLVHPGRDSHRFASGCLWQVNHLPCRPVASGGAKASSCSWPLDDDLVAALASRSRALLPKMGSSKRLSHSSTAPVVGDYEAGDPMATDDQLVEVGRLLSAEPVGAQVGQDEQTSLYRPVGAATLRDPPGIGVAIGDQRSLSRPWRRPEPS